MVVRVLLCGWRKCGGFYWGGGVVVNAKKGLFAAGWLCFARHGAWEGVECAL